MIRTNNQASQKTLEAVNKILDNYKLENEKKQNNVVAPPKINLSPTTGTKYSILDETFNTINKPFTSMQDIENSVLIPKQKQKEEDNKKALQDFVKYSNVPKVLPTSPTIQNIKNVARDVSEKGVGLLTGLLDSASLGLVPTVSKITPGLKDSYNIIKQAQENQPVTTTIGNVLGYIAPGVGMTKGLKLLPGVNKILPTATDGVLKTAGKVALTGGIENAPITAVERGFENARENKPFFENFGSNLSEGGMYGALAGGVLGGAFKGIAKGASNINNAINKSIDNTMGEFTSNIKPSIEGINIKPIPEELLPRVSKEIPLKYKQPLPKIDTPLMLPEGNKFTVPQQYKIETAGDPTRNIKQIQDFKPSINVTYPKIDTTTPNLIPKQQSNINLLPEINNANIGQNKANFGKDINVTPKTTKYSPEVQSKLDELEQNFKKLKETNRFADPVTKEKWLKGEAMKYSSQKREIIQGDLLIPVEGGLTNKELASKINLMKSNHKGKQVITPDGEGVITGNSFGKIGVNIDGKVKYYNSNDVTSKINVDDLIRQQEATQKQITPIKEQVNTNTFEMNKSFIKPSTIIKNSNVEFSTDLIKQPKLIEQPKPPKPPKTIKEFNAESGKTKDRKFISNSYMNTEVTTPKMKAEMKTKIPQYKEITNQKTLDEANEIIGNDLKTHADEFLSAEKLNNALDTAKGISLIQKATAKGDINLANDISINLAEKLTNAGQTVQAASILKRMTPEGMLQYANKKISQANNELAKKGKPFEKIKLNEEETNLIVNNMKEIQKVMGKDIKLIPLNLQLFANEKLAEIMKVIAKKIPANMGEKLKAYQRTNLLFNPKTMIRNTLGNIISLGASNIKDVIGAGIDKALSKITGKRTFLLPNIKTQLEGGKKGFDRVTSDYKKGINTSPTGTQYELDGRNISPFKNKILKGLDELTTTGLRYGDDPFYQANFDDVLRREMKLKNVTEPDAEMLAKADQVAKERTFQDTNKITKLFATFQRALNFVGTKEFGLGNIVMPFVKTPANILARALEYSPLELSKTIKQTYNAISKNGNFDQYKFVDSLAKSLTGTSLIGAGYYLAEKGIIKGDASKDVDARNFENVVGLLPYSFKVGEKTFTYDWAQPKSIPLAIGADIYFNLKNSKNPENVLIEAGKSGVSTLFSQTLVQGLTKLFGGNSYGNNTGIVDNLVNLGLNASTQFVPLASIQRQLAENMDPYKREFTDESIVKSKAINPVINTIPFARQNLPIKVNTVGEKVKSNKWFDIFLNPSKSSEYKSNKVYDELLRLNSQSNENMQFPTKAKNEISYKTSKKGNIEKLKMSPQQLMDFQEMLGKRNIDAVNKVINTKEYVTLNDKQKAKAISDEMSKVKQKTENEFLKLQGINEYIKKTKNRRTRRSR
jgi:hypothetical protein